MSNKIVTVELSYTGGDLIKVRINRVRKVSFQPPEFTKPDTDINLSFRIGQAVCSPRRLKEARENHQDIFDVTRDTIAAFLKEEFAPEFIFKEGEINNKKCIENGVWVSGTFKCRFEQDRHYFPPMSVQY